MNDRIEGKVAAILNLRELILNVGSTQGVEQGMRFAVLNTQGLSIRDPDTDQPLGAVEIAKVLVEVVRVQEKLSVGRTYRTTKKNIGGMSPFGLGLSESLLQPRRFVDVPETLESDEHRYEEELSEADSVVNIGDIAVQIEGDEFL